MILKVASANSVDPDQEQSDQGPHCLPVCKFFFKKSTRIFSRRHKQTTFSDAVFLGALRVKGFLFLSVRFCMNCFVQFSCALMKNFVITFCVCMVLFLHWSAISPLPSLIFSGFVQL